MRGAVAGRLAAMMFLQYFGLGAWVVPLTRYLQTLPVNGGMGFSPPQVALVYATFAVGALIAPLVVGLLAGACTIHAVRGHGRTTRRHPEAGRCLLR